MSNVARFEGLIFGIVHLSAVLHINCIGGSRDTRINVEGVRLECTFFIMFLENSAKTPCENTQIGEKSSKNHEKCTFKPDTFYNLHTPIRL